tara:strand:+ start:467 stop:751 length:285 start_codon:yes stop_codon:yes gene_type:complete
VHRFAFIASDLVRQGPFFRIKSFFTFTMSDNVQQVETMNDIETPTRKPRTAKISVKLTEEEKKALDKIAWDKDDSVSRIIRQALAKEFPQVFGR